MLRRAGAPGLILIIIIYIIIKLTGLTGSEFASQETIQSVSTITGEHIEINAKGNETLEAFSETEKILKNLSQDAIRCLQSTGIR